MTIRGWFLPETPDLLGMLMKQVEVTVEGMDAFSVWAAGHPQSGDIVRGCEHRADKLKRELQLALRETFIAPIDPEDLFTVSRGLDWVINRAKDTVGESEVIACPPDKPLAEMAELLAHATRHLATAISQLAPGGADPADAADAAVKAERGVEHVYRRAMAGLLDSDDLREVTARRELYRRCSRIGEAVVNVAERVGYAVLKES